MDELDRLLNALDGRRPAATTWPFLLAAAFVVVVATLATTDPARALRADYRTVLDAVGGELGYSTIPGLMLAGGVWGGLYLLALRTRNPEAGGRYFLILAAVAILTQTLAVVLPVLGVIHRVL